MKYLKLTESGYELKIDSSVILPDGCIELSDDDYSKLISGEFVYKDGAIIPYVAQIDPKLAIIKQIAELEASITQRRLREALISGDYKFINSVDAQIAALRAQL